MERFVKVLLLLVFSLLMGCEPDKLIVIQGSNQSANVFRSSTRVKSGIYVESVKLSFFLDNYKRKMFCIEIDMANNEDENRLKSILRKIEKSEVIKVWIDEKDENEPYPTVYKLEVDDRVIYVKQKSRWFSVYTIVGVGVFVLLMALTLKPVWVFVTKR